MNIIRRDAFIELIKQDVIARCETLLDIAENDNNKETHDKILEDIKAILLEFDEWLKPDIPPKQIIFLRNE